MLGFARAVICWSEYLDSRELLEFQNVGALENSARLQNFDVLLSSRAREEGPRAVDRWESTINEPTEKAAMRNSGGAPK